jgi:hypothetical protein
MCCLHISYNIQPQKPRKASGFSLFVKEHYSTLKAGSHKEQQPGGMHYSISSPSLSSLSHGEVMKALSKMYKAAQVSNSSSSSTNDQQTVLHEVEEVEDDDNPDIFYGSSSSSVNVVKNLFT